MNTFEYEKVIIKNHTVRLKCSRCKQLVPFRISGIPTMKIFTYCPYCGAKRIDAKNDINKVLNLS